ncbi:MAG: hypothetical protein J3K34DRAFT_525508 [Monoraphidium minutum]|nr:MAG: hypothetical protein J3K34DRAFT_525508 [Monoraphidium minutum]
MRGPAGGGGGLLPRLWHTPPWATLLLVSAAGCGLGYLYPNRNIPAPWGMIQSATGWTYTAAWSLSFWPQARARWLFKLAYASCVLLHLFVKDVSGFSFDFLALNLLGWVAYTFFNVGIYWGVGCAPLPLPPGGAPPFALPGAGGGGLHFLEDAGFGGGGGDLAAALAGGGGGGGIAAAPHCQTAVDLNDVVFSVHAFVLTFVALVQCAVYPNGGQRVHPAVRGGIGAAVAAAAAYAAAVGAAGGAAAALPAWLRGRLTWVGWLYFLSFLKMGVTLVKYIPQVVFNARRRSTKGWSIANCNLDLFGSVLSMGQQVITCWSAGTWAAITSNPVKLGLAVISMAMDVIFIVQHYVLFPEEEEVPLKYTYTVDAMSGALSVVFEECHEADGSLASGPLRSARSAPARSGRRSGGGSGGGARPRPPAPPPAPSSGASGAGAPRLSKVAIAPALTHSPMVTVPQPVSPRPASPRSPAAGAARPPGRLAAKAPPQQRASPFITAVAAAAEASGCRESACGGAALRVPLLSVTADGSSVVMPMLSVHSVTVIVEEVDASDLLSDY